MEKEVESKLTYYLYIYFLFCQVFLKILCKNRLFSYNPLTNYLGNSLFFNSRECLKNLNSSCLQEI